MGWKIKGEAGKMLNATLRPVEDLNIDDTLAVAFETLAEDTLTWQAATTSAAGAGTIVPDAGQVVELLDPDGTRRFRGHVTLPRVGKNMVSVKAVGPWWWMERIPLSGNITDAAGTSGERAAYVFPTQGLKESLQQLIDRAIEKGVPMARGAISDMFQVPKITLANMSFASALAELLRWVPDAVAWFDYTVDGLPEIRITRRGAMTALEYELGVDRIEEIDLSPRLDLEVKGVSLKWVKRDPTTGKPMWAKKNHGTAPDGKFQIVTISGPEIADTLPLDDFDSVKVKTKAANFGTGDFFELDPVLKKSVEDFGPFLGNVSGLISNAGWHRVVSGDLADWMRKDYGLKKKTIRVAAWVNGTYAAASSEGLGKCANYLKSIGRLSWAVGGTGDTNTFKLYVDFSVECINLSYPKSTTVRKKWDYEYLFPPEDLAQNLKEAQDFVPMEGDVTLVADEVSGVNRLGRKLNILGGHPDHASMNAMIRRVSYEIGRGRWTISPGTPARTDYGTLVSRIRREPSDNIVWIDQP